MILVLTTPRTGSTWFCEHLAKNHSLENLDEYFGKHEISLEEQITKLEYLQSNKNTVLKCFPWHFKNLRANFPRANFLEKNLLKLADKIYILVRNDFNSQCKSYYLAKSTDVWSGIPQEHIDVTVDNVMYEYYVNHLIDGYMQLAEYYKTFDCEVIDYNSLAFNREERYVRPVTWVNEPKSIDFNVEKLFT